MVAYIMNRKLEPPPQLQSVTKDDGGFHNTPEAREGNMHLHVTQCMHNI